MSTQRYFKFLKTKWADALVNSGAIRITTIGICRTTEVGKGRSDSGENMLYPFRSMAKIREMPDGRTRIQSGRFVSIDAGPDLFVYCVSHAQPRQMEIQFASGDDSWVEIFDPAGFFSAIDKAIGALGHTPKGLKAVSYRPRQYHHSETPPDDAHLIKEPNFVHEDEARACWNPAAQPIKELDLDIPELTKYCRINCKVLP
jgi:hypothetical protein